MSRPWIAKGKPFCGIFASKGKRDKKLNATDTSGSDPLQDIKDRFPPWCGEMAGRNAQILMERQDLEYWELRAKKVAAQRQALLDQSDVDNLESLSNGESGVMPKR